MPDTVFPYDDEVVDPYRDDDTKNPHEATGGEVPPADEGDAEAAPSPKRKPGRPRKTDT